MNEDNSLSKAWKRRSKSSLDFGFILLSNSFLILSSFSFCFRISSVLSHSSLLSLSSRRPSTKFFAAHLRKKDWITTVWKKINKHSKMSLISVIFPSSSLSRWPNFLTMLIGSYSISLKTEMYREICGKIKRSPLVK